MVSEEVKAVWSVVDFSMKAAIKLVNVDIIQLTMTLIVVLSSAISPWASISILRLRSPLATALVTSAIDWKGLITDFRATRVSLK